MANNYLQQAVRRDRFATDHPLSRPQVQRRKTSRHPCSAKVQSEQFDCQAA